jgi:hypothetical protein
MESMSSRERILARLAGRPTDRLPFVIHWGPWADTLARWRAEGMRSDDEWRAPFGFDPLNANVGVNVGIDPPFRVETLADEGDTVVLRDAQGVVKRDRKSSTTMPEFLDYPVKDWKSWLKHKERFMPDTSGRFPPDWEARRAEAARADGLVTVGVYPYGFLGGPRTMMGAEACLIAFALEPELIEDIGKTLCDLWCAVWERVFQEVRVDHIALWEDMSGKQGSLISPAMFRRFLTPHYRRIAELARRHGVKVISVDSDGFIHELTGLFLEAGVTAILPYEVQAGNDLPLLLRRHPDLAALGWMDKRAMARDHAAMDAEMERIRPVLPLGRYIPYPDHLIPADVPWQNYQYFVWRWKELCGKRE